jgi:hypothetical protein
MTHEDHTHEPPEGDPKPTAYALRVRLTLPRPLAEAGLRERVDAFLAELTPALRSRGCRLIGHIKGILDAEQKGHLFFSVTSFEQATRFKGVLEGEAEKMELTLNVIVYGVGSEEIEPLVRAGLQQHLGEISPMTPRGPTS